jgi:hypothetical protein
MGQLRREDVGGGWEVVARSSLEIVAKKDDKSRYTVEAVVPMYLHTKVIYIFSYMVIYLVI